MHDIQGKLGVKNMSDLTINAIKILCYLQFLKNTKYV